MTSTDFEAAKKSRRVRRFEEKLRKHLAKMTSGSIDRIGRIAEKELRKHTGGVSGLCFNNDHESCQQDPEIREGCLCWCHNRPCPHCGCKNPDNPDPDCDGGCGCHKKPLPITLDGVPLVGQYEQVRN